ncbi:phosphatidylinositol-glycan biosynthesis class w protein [Holotrichia oblita]|uniref:Phosphatidylinositol-glycan biosynthesis class w protein n=1 Tax=Holotrichia oblita TaxID=644536 RepID=A0ACB9TI62_HOLOL|nr:phosphatidylinositol-glycan biosynthesis class w protein [Holotrichia oblita]
MLDNLKDFADKTGDFLQKNIKWDVLQGILQKNSETMSNSSSAYEVLSVILPSVLLVFICTTLTTVYSSKLEKIRWRYVCDFCIVAVPQIFNITVLVSDIHIVHSLTSLISLCVIILAYANRRGNKYKNVNFGDKKGFVTNVRSTTNILTVIAILAVDFKIFPKQFKKQLKYGYSLMDVGVGLFVYANAIVAPEIRTRDNSLKKSFIDTVPLIILGIGRYVATTLTDYNVSITEYGKHWNFFITLAFTRIIASIILIYLPIKFSAIYGILMLVFHEVILQNGLAEYVMGSSHRNNFFSANREGIVSTLGFVGLYFLSISVGIWMNLKERGMNSLLVKFTIICVILLPTTFTLEHHFGVSRRLANSAYCVWILFLGVFVTALFYVTEIFQRFLYERCGFANHITVPFLLDAINYNGLIYFLLANILTGFVNMSCDTMFVEPTTSLFILIAYVCVTSIVVSFMYVHKINLKVIVSYLTKPKRKSMI